MSLLPTRAGAVHVADGGPTGHGCLVLVHGAAVTGEMWRPQVDALEGTLRVIVPDLPGHGRSEPLREAVTVGALAGAVRDVLDGCAVGSAVVAGHSLGGMVAQVLAAEQPHRVRSLVLLETAVGTRTTPWERVGSAIAARVLSSRWATMPRLASASARSYGVTPASRAYLRETMAAMDPESFRHVWAAVEGYDGREVIGRIRCPTTVVVAGRNRRTHPQGRRIADALSQGRLEVVRDAHHLLTLDRPDEVTAILRAGVALGEQGRA